MAGKSAIPLRVLLARRGREYLHNLCSSFSCQQDPDIERFLHERAVEFERLSKSRTYFIFNADDINAGADYPAILGYISLSLKVLNVPADISNRRRKDLDGLSAKPHGRTIQAFPCYLIGRLARNSNVDRSMISGADLPDIANDIITSAVDIVGGRYMMIECADNEKLLRFYRSSGFTELGREDDDSRSGAPIMMIQMIRMIETRRESSGQS